MGADGLQNAAQMGKVRAKVGHRSRLSVRVMEIIGNRAKTAGNHLETVRKQLEIMRKSLETVREPDPPGGQDYVTYKTYD